MEYISTEQIEYQLFIDESGTPSIKDKKSKFYILAGCSVSKQERNDIKIWADHIKFKYWNKTNIVFHSKEIGRKENDFKILKDIKTYNLFLKDLYDFLEKSRFKMLYVLIDKKEARKLAWNKNKIYKDTSFYLIKNFLLVLLAGGFKGKIIIESATAEKDFYLHKIISNFLSEGLKDPTIDYKKIQKTITSVSFVTKNNYDIEEQIADLFSYAAKCKYIRDKKIRSNFNSYEKIMLDLFNKKIFKVPQRAGKGKLEFFQKVKPFKILP